MQVSERTIKRLAEILTGDKGLSPYRTGPKLVGFFNEFGLNDVYPSGGGFPSRWDYAERSLRKFNGTPALRKIILSIVDPRDYSDATIYDPATQQRKPAEVRAAVEHINESLDYDGFEIVPHGKTFDIIDKTRGEILLEIKRESNHLSHEFIREQVEKCRLKVSQRDNDGAITNARSLVEASAHCHRKRVRYGASSL